MSRPHHLPRRIRRNTKPLDALKAGTIIVGLLILCILILWMATQFFRPDVPEQDVMQKRTEPMWNKMTPGR